MQAQLMQRRGMLPKTAGDVPIHYKGHKHTKPRLKGRSIVLPRRFSRFDKLFPLMEGKQFLFFQRPRRYESPRLWFAGLDETHPFVTKIELAEPLERRSWIEFKNYGETAFYAKLKPPGIRWLEDKFKTTAGRQGDWWFLSLPYSWDELKKAYEITQGGELKAQGVAKRRLSRTHHRLTGVLFKLEYGFEIRGIGLAGGFLAEGLLEAPHHATRTLTGPHFLVQRGKD